MFFSSVHGSRLAPGPGKKSNHSKLSARGPEAKDTASPERPLGAISFAHETCKTCRHPN